MQNRKAEATATAVVAGGFVVALGGALLALGIIAAAWTIYPGTSDWRNCDLDAPGRIFIATAGGRAVYENFSVYNFALLTLGFAAIAFWSSRALLSGCRATALRRLFGGGVMGLGIIISGIAPGDVPGLTHVAGIVTATAAFALLLLAATPADEPGRRVWLVVFVVCPALLCFAPALYWQIFTLLLPGYLAAQSLLLIRRVRRGELTVRPDMPALLRRYSGAALVATTLIMLFTIVTALLLFPGDRGSAGFDWERHWTSIAGNVFLAAPDGTVYFYDKFMIYNGALALGGVGAALYFGVRATAAGKWRTGVAIQLAGLIFGAALTAIGMAPTGALALHRWGINLTALAVAALLLLQLRAGANDAMPRSWRRGFLILIFGSALFFAAGFGGRPVAVLGQKIMILEAVLYLISQGVWQWRTDGRLLSLKNEMTDK